MIRGRASCVKPAPTATAVLLQQFQQLVGGHGFFGKDFADFNKQGRYRGRLAPLDIFKPPRMATYRALPGLIEVLHDLARLFDHVFAAGKAQGMNRFSPERGRLLKFVDADIGLDFTPLQRGRATQKGDVLHQLGTGQKRRC